MDATAALAATSVDGLLAAYATLTHRLHSLRPYNGTVPGARVIADTRAQRDAIADELKRRAGE